MDHKALLARSLVVLLAEFVVFAAITQGVGVPAVTTV